MQHGEKRQKKWGMFVKWPMQNGRYEYGMPEAADRKRLSNTLYGRKDNSLKQGHRDS
ncbi:hypothetical protein AA106556_1614 [Neokomagataea tanensis NBRC 106556]|uniref:Transposase n=1 Tax=Neokomagataea tanensis NBRC 106556 TaxID=1223519 RepID=A0ABQ0QKD5_9PROT|nr:hypothetical protein AA106556_1614 [Neokomagataea tanensis NBRC 106556]